ncbi:MAG: hypothetical protein R3E82_21140 [Pseudomonadales bacterium]
MSIGRGSLKATLIASTFSPVAAIAICFAWVMVTPILSPEDASFLGSFNAAVPVAIAGVSYILVLTIGTMAHWLLLTLGLNYWWSYAITGFVGMVPLWFLVSDTSQILHLLWMSTISVPTAISYWWIYNYVTFHRL